VLLGGFVWLHGIVVLVEQRAAGCERIDGARLLGLALGGHRNGPTGLGRGLVGDRLAGIGYTGHTSSLPALASLNRSGLKVQVVGVRTGWSRSVLVKTSPSRVEYEGEAPKLFEPVAVERPQRRLSKAESLAYVRTIRARLHRSDREGAESSQAHISPRQVA
jgi:hypothetical protein